MSEIKSEVGFSYTYSAKEREELERIREKYARSESPAEDKLQRLGEELEYTARLRLENDSASLAELALMHVPPISKSGLNSRLARIVKVAGEIAKEKES